jgi:hypothetical protein
VIALNSIATLNIDVLKNKKPVEQSQLKRVSHALAAFIMRPQAENQIGAYSF